MVRWEPPRGWWSASYEQTAVLGWTCAECGFDLRPNGPNRRAGYHIHDPAEECLHVGPVRRLVCGLCCNDGADELARLSSRLV
ncbi:hypothetical protein OG225_41170 (plasmid) [Nocardia sp. NBC_01377]